MLFNSYEFIFMFFPAVLAIYFVAGKFDAARAKEGKFSSTANIWLTAASFAFYGWWDVRFLPLLVVSILTNYFIAGKILGSREENQKTRRSKFFFLLGLTFNIGLLGYFKYLDFFLSTLNRLGANFELLHLILPLGISFFTITQLLYIYDCYEGTVTDRNFIDYALFVSFFPHLMAGPILYHRQMLRQFRNVKLRSPDFDNLSHGLTIFIIGLAKKVIVADSLSPYVQFGYAHVNDLTGTVAWLTAVCYMLQLYFDFSGYSDMAVGLARMMNYEIPINFNSPYRATGMINFWQRWHISLTNAITACVYIPLVRQFKSKTVANTAAASFITFFIVGIWHGAGMTFVIFAILNAAGVVANFLWRQKFSMPKVLAHFVTLFHVLITLIFFRANSVSDALVVIKKMFAGIFDGLANLPDVLNLPEYVAASPVELPKFILVAAILIVAFCPNSNKLTKNLKPNFLSAAILALLFLYSVLHLSGVTEFLYFQF